MIQNFTHSITSFVDTQGIYFTEGRNFDLKERHYTMEIEPPNKNFFTNLLIVDIFVFTAAII